MKALPRANQYLRQYKQYEYGDGLGSLARTQPDWAPGAKRSSRQDPYRVVPLYCERGDLPNSPDVKLPSPHPGYESTEPAVATRTSAQRRDEHLIGSL